MRTRQDLEKNESLILAPYASLSAACKGRRHAEPEHLYRTAFQRDRDRIVHTRAFRRLEYKTQVFVNHEGDHYRTRLTHTLEVSQIARTIARALAVNEDLTDAICLAHDLGHTPFGHTGQDVMAELMKSHGGFEHNRQSFRILTLLESPYPNFKGLNLTNDVLEGLMKHATEYDLADGSKFAKSGHPTIEAQIANFADEIAYNNHDVDDGLNSGLLELGQMRQVKIWEKHFQAVKKSHPELPIKRQIRVTVNHLINELVTDLIHNTEKQLKDRGIHSIDDVKSNGQGLVGFSETVRAENAELKKFLFKNLYRHWHVERMAEKAHRVVSELFNAFVANSRILPQDFLDQYPDKEDVYRIVCDYIAGMTDRFALDEYAKLFDPRAKV